MIKKFYFSNFFLFFMMFLGGYIGLLNKEISESIYRIGEIYLKILQLSITPIIICSIGIGIYHLRKSPNRITKKIFIFSSVIILLNIIFAIIFSFLLKPWKHIKDISVFRNIFASEVNKPTEMVYYHDLFDNKSKNVDFSKLLDGVIPKNYFESLSLNNSLEIITGTILIIISLYVISDKHKFSTSAFNGFDFSFKIFSKINDWLLALMPIGVFFIMSNQFFSTGTEILISISNISITIVLFTIISSIFSFIIIKIKSKKSYSEVYDAISENLKILISSRSGTIGLPTSIKALKKLKFNSYIVDLFLPIGITMLRVGTMVFFIMFTIFTMGIFNIDFTFQNIFFVSILSIFASIACAGSPSILVLQKMSLIFIPMGLPFESVFPIIVASFVIVDLFETILNTFVNLAIVALSETKEKEIKNEMIN